jgi:hypothetical protein
MVVDSGGNGVTAREYPHLLLVRPELIPGGVRLRAPGVDDIEVAEPQGPLTEVSLFHRRPFAASLADDAAHAWMSAVVGEPSRFVFQDDPTRRPTNPEVGATSDRVSLADGYPLLVTTEESLDALNTLIAQGPMASAAPLAMTRFRPSIVVSGDAAWAEDGWRRLRVGEAEFRAVKGCDRCVMTTIDPNTARAGKEPIATLARHRKWDGATWFGMNLVPDTPGVEIHIGDEVEVLSSVPAPDGPPR